MEDNTGGPSEFKPGETIHPSDAAAPATASPQVAAPVQAQTSSPPPAPDTPEPAAAAPLAQPFQTVQSPPAPVPDAASRQSATDDEDGITWTASEFADHDKSFDWYLGLAVAAILSAVALYVLFRDIITSVTPVVAALALGFYARRQPRQLQYTVDSEGIQIGTKFLPYEQFRSFAVMEEGPFVSLAFLPLKRFGLLTTVYLDPQDEDNIIDLISEFLPLEPREHDPIDRLMKRIRF